MSELSLISVAVVAAGALRQMFVLSAIVRSGQFLHRRQDIRPPGPAGEALAPWFFIVVPVLREAALLRETVAHFRALACGHTATVVVVTTAREAAEAGKHGGAGDTVAVARELAQEGQCAHVHYPDPLGLKGDQLNHAAVYCAAILPDGVPPWQAFLVCYDADSRPPPGSLGCFAQAINDNPGADVFHQSSRFELRVAHRPARGLWKVDLPVCGAGALRANRFVLGYEIPRLLNRSAQVSAMRRALCSGVYAHVTGHGLCVRLSLLQKLPFPVRSPLEDMHYSFILGSRAVPMVAVPSLDTSEVPATVTTQVRQAARWFFGPARFARYLKDPATELPHVSRTGNPSTIYAVACISSSSSMTSCGVL